MTKKKLAPILVALVALAVLLAGLAFANHLVAENVAKPQCAARCARDGAPSSKFEMVGKRPTCACIDAEGVSRDPEPFYPNPFAPKTDGDGSAAAYAAMQLLIALGVGGPFLLAIWGIKRWGG